MQGRTCATFASSSNISSPYSPECVEGVSLLKNSFDDRYLPRSRAKWAGFGAFGARFVVAIGPMPTFSTGWGILRISNFRFRGFSKVRIAPVPLGDHPPNHRCYHDRRSGLANPQKSPQALLSDASTATIAITKASVMIMLPTITSQLPGTEMSLMAL